MVIGAPGIVVYLLRCPKKVPTDSDSVMVRASASGAGGRGFDPGPGHTKDFKNGTSGYKLLGTQHYKASTGFSSPKKQKYSITNIACLI